MLYLTVEERGNFRMLSKAEKKTLIKRFYTGESAKDIAHENNIPLSTLYYWINKNKPLRANRCSSFTQAEYHELKNEADKLSIEIEILQKALDYLNTSRRSRLQFSEEIYSLYSSRVIAEALKINRSTLYHHINHNKNENAWFYKYEERMKSEILKVYAEHNGNIGVERIVAILRRKGIRTSSKYISKLLSELNLRNTKTEIERRRRMEIKDIRKHNLLLRNYEVMKPNQVWLTDSTLVYINKRPYWVCICMDLFSRKVLSIRISPNNSTRLSKSTLVAAIQNRDIKPGLILHSDRGSNFISYTYNKYLKDHHIIHSYSRPSTPTDNAPLESFNRTLKDAILLNEAGKSYSTVRKHISKFMDYYNNIWLKFRLLYAKTHTSPKISRFTDSDLKRCRSKSRSRRIPLRNFRSRNFVS